METKVLNNYYKLQNQLSDIRDNYSLGLLSDEDYTRLVKFQLNLIQATYKLYKKLVQINKY